MSNPFVHVELNTQALPQAKEFYGRLFNWNLHDIPMGPDFTYTGIGVGEGTGGGMMQHPMPGAPSFWLPYVLVDDIRASTEKARALGATFIRENMEVTGMGWFTILQDPSGAVLGMWQAKPRG